jgi:hypothetical protein
MGPRAARRLVHAAAVAFAFTVGAAPSASAADRWTQTGHSVTSLNYWQGITFDPAARSFNFDGPGEGLWRTSATLQRLAGRSQGIPSQVKSTEGWNHVGDLSYDKSRGRLLVPLECYSPSAPDPNTCMTGGIAVVDPVTLAWQYYVKLGPQEIQKAMWAEASPDGRWLWTSSGTDLLAYDATQIAPANAGPAGTQLRAAKRFRGVLRAASVSGAAFDGGRLYIAYDRGTYIQILSYPVDPGTGDVGNAWRLEIQRTKTSTLHETEGLAFGSALNGRLHWQIQPQVPLYSAIYTFVPSGAGTG